MRDKSKDRARSLHTMATGKLLDDLLGTGVPEVASPATWRPPTDVYECEEMYMVRMAVSGLKSDAEGHITNAEIEMEDDVLTVRGRREDDCPHAKHGFYQMEIHYGYFECRVRIHAPFDRDGVSARYRDGFLEIAIPKAASTPRGTRRIEVQG